MNEPQLTAEMNETMSAYMMKCPHCQTIIDLPQEKETPMQNEPQLSAEMEKRFDEEFDHFVLDVGESGETVDWDRVKHFLATALEEQRLGYIAQVKELSYKTGRIEAYAKVDDLSKQRVVTQDILSILNGKE